MNFIHTFWPSLLNQDFVYSLPTPIVKAIKDKNSINFYNLSDYNLWLEKDLKNYKIKYYKGLGTSTDKEAKEYFTDIDDKIINYNLDRDLDINIAFDKHKADDRKEWLSRYDKNRILDNNVKNIKISEFINNELIHFSIYSNLRAIPKLIDGLKPC
jgi:DNA topoisomerase-2